MLLESAGVPKGPKITALSKALVIKINLVFLAFFLTVYAGLLLRPSSSIYFENAASLVRCSLRECHHKAENGIKMKAVLEETPADTRRPNKSVISSRVRVPSFLNEMISEGKKVGIVNIEEDELNEWSLPGEAIPVNFERVSSSFNWTDLFPEWIDEEEESDVPTCPEIPIPDFTRYGKMDMILAKLPCKSPEDGWGRDVFRLQLHLIVANLAVRKSKTDWNWRAKVVFLSKCRPMMELFRCDDMIRQEGDWWYFEPEIQRLEQKISLPVGSCKLAMPLWGKGIDEVYDLSGIRPSVRNGGKAKREAYATVIHSSEAYICGAIILAQSLLQTGTKRDLVLLMDKSISDPKRDSLIAAGWKIKIITRIRNPRAEKDSYNEYNYSKFRLWQLTDYDKIIFIDSDIVVLRNLDLLFSFPQMSATGNDASIFNSGIMVIEPSNCTFQTLMDHRSDIISYNGGDQGFLNEVFVWWHRLPRRVNFLKNFWSNSSLERSIKNELFSADPPKVYTIHYLGLKPWQCYRDYDCNWDLELQHVYASDVAHRRWWKLHDKMGKGLQKFCSLTKQRKIELDWDRRLARKRASFDEHWKINITDPRRKRSRFID